MKKADKKPSILVEAFRIDSDGVLSDFFMFGALLIATGGTIYSFFNMLEASEGAMLNGAFTIATHLVFLVILMVMFARVEKHSIFAEVKAIRAVADES